MFTKFTLPSCQVCGAILRGQTENPTGFANVNKPTIQWDSSCRIVPGKHRAKNTTWRRAKPCSISPSMILGNKYDRVFKGASESVQASTAHQPNELTGSDKVCNCPGYLYSTPGESACVYSNENTMPPAIATIIRKTKKNQRLATLIE